MLLALIALALYTDRLCAWPSGGDTRPWPSGGDLVRDQELLGAPR